MKKLANLFKKVPSRYWLLALVVAVAVSCVSVSGTFASFQSTVIGTGETPVADWNIEVKINSEKDTDKDSVIGNISLAGDETHQNRDAIAGFNTMSAYKFAPGTAGYMPVEIDGSAVDMSVLITVRGYFVNLPEDVVFYDNLGNSLTIERNVSGFEPTATTSITGSVSAISYQYYVSYQEVETWKTMTADSDGGRYINIGFRWAWINNGDDDAQTTDKDVYNEVRVTGLQVTNANQLRNAKTIHFVDSADDLITDNAKVLNVFAKTIDASGLTIEPTADFYLDVNDFTTKDAVYTVKPSASVTKVVLGTNRREIDYKTAENRPTVAMNSASTLAYISSDFRYNHGTVQAKNYSAPLLVKNMNSILDDYPADTMYDALANVIAQVSNTTTYDYGTNFASLDTIGELATFIAGGTDGVGAEILWSVESKQFIYAQDGEEVLIYNMKTVDTTEKVNFFKAYSEMPATQTYSIYLTGNSLTTAITGLTVGLDVGENTGITAVTYDRSSATTAQSAIIRTNSDTVAVTINAPLDVVKHYGTACSVNIIKVASDSLHEYGEVELVKIKAGHVELENGSDVNGIYIYNDTSYNDDGSINGTAASSFADVKITVESGAEQPKLSRSAVTVNAESGTKVCTVVNGTNAEDYYLFKQGIYEQVKVVDAGNSISSDSSARWANTTNNTVIETVADQIANDFNGTRNNGVIADKEITVSETDYVVSFNTSTRDFEVYAANDTSKETKIVAQAIVDNANNAVVTDGGKSADVAEKESALKGTGTKDDPYIIYDYATMQKITDLYDLGYNYFKVKDGVTSIDCTGWVPVYLNGSFDGNGVSFTNVTACLFQNVGYKLENKEITLKDFSAAMNVSATQQYGACALVKNIFNAGTTTFDSVNVHGTLDGYWNIGSYYNYGTANYDDIGCDYTVNFINCKSDATLICTSGNTCGGFLGHGYEGAGHTQTLNIDANSEYTGTIYTTNGSGGHYIAMNSTGSLVFNGVETSCYDSSFTEYGEKEKINNTAATKESNGYKVAVDSNAKKVVVAVTAQLTAYESDNETKIQNLSGITMTLGSKEYTNINSDTVILDEVTSAKINTNQSDYGYSIENGVLNVNVKGNTNYRTGTMRLTVSQYDEKGNIICCGTINLYTIE